jgi:4-hydroxy-tetrahydrodipicolinate synthase
MAVFTGSGVALVTPFNADGGVNYAKMTELIDRQLENGTDAIIICGTTGEASTLADDEHIECVRVAVAHVNGRAPVVAGAGSNDTAHGERLCRECRKAGADAVLTATPYYNKTTQKGLVEHFTALANAAEIPLILYNIPVRTNLNITPKTAARLCEVENIAGIKEANGEATHFSALAAATSGRLDIYAGNDDMILPVMSVGGIGVISTMANVIPRDTHDICDLFLKGRVKEAAALQLKAIPLIERLFCEVNPIPVKRALNMMGLNVGGYRRPLTEMDEKNAEGLEAVMRAYGLIA